MDAANPTAIIIATLGGLLGGGGIVAIYRAILDRRAQPVQLRNTAADTELKRLLQAKTMTEMVSLLTEDLDEALTSQRKTQRDNTERLKAMQLQIDAMREKCIRVDAQDAQIALLSGQVERARRNGYLDRENKGQSGPNPAAGGPDGG